MYGGWRSGSEVRVCVDEFSVIAAYDATLSIIVGVVYLEFPFELFVGLGLIFLFCFFLK